ncbi:MAG: outer membrane protein assembly factor BamE [Gammaproteobacteria bacterium]|nr:MAG: outer membrane protein assembly factor BamE [Gammaproteobacteria bacterium]RLA60997.1 MAG: outer membrane protein assembly factor BamE [Gammaproteobacteria bacterium]
MRILLISLAITCLSACGFVGFPGVYKINVEQGNIIDQEIADQLKPGMSRRQVRFIMGTPMIEDTFNQDRWDYAYVMRNGRNVLSESRITVIFEGDSLLSVEGDYLPPAWSDASTVEEEPALEEPDEPTGEPAG